MPYKVAPATREVFMAKLSSLPVTRRMRNAVIGINIAIVVAGVILLCLCSKLKQYIVDTPEDERPRLWVVGLMPLLYGIAGTVVLYVSNKKVTIAWLVVSSILWPVYFWSISRDGCLDFRLYHVDLHIFATCVRSPHLCSCSWRNHTWTERVPPDLLLPPTDLPLPPDDAPLPLPPGPWSCPWVRESSVVYLGVVVALMFCLLLLLCSFLLTAIPTCCLHCCIYDESRRYLYSTIHGARTKRTPADGPSFSATVYSLRRNRNRNEVHV